MNMDFQNIKKVEKADALIDLALSRATQKVKETRKKFKGPLEKKKYQEIIRNDTIKGTLASRLQKIEEDFPSLDNMSEFYIQMVEATLDYRKFKKSLGAVNWAKKQAGKLSGTYRNRMVRAKSPEELQGLQKEFLGRISSVVKQIDNELKYLENARRALRNFPSIKEDVPTVAICGFPNVGKSTLLTKLSTAKPEINNYPFTTKMLNLGYTKEGIQLIDTPGTLNRPEKMNKTEKLAYLAIKNCAELCIYVFDLTEPYPMEMQHELYKQISELKPTIIFLSKQDIIGDKINPFKMDAYKDIEELKKDLPDLIGQT